LIQLEDKFKCGLDHDHSGAGYWFDWVFAEILLEEATKPIEDSPAVTETER